MAQAESKITRPSITDELENIRRKILSYAEVLVDAESYRDVEYELDSILEDLSEEINILLSYIEDISLVKPRSED